MDRRFVFSVWCVWFSVCGVRLTNCVGRPVNHFDRNIVGCAINVSHGATSTFICVFLPLFFYSRVDQSLSMGMELRCVSYNPVERISEIRENV